MEPNIDGEKRQRLNEEIVNTENSMKAADEQGQIASVGDWKNDAMNGNDFSSSQQFQQLQLQQMAAMHQQQMQMQMNSNVVNGSPNYPFPSGPSGLSNAMSQQQKQQHQMTMAAMAHGLPVHMFSRIAQLPPAQQQLFHHHHQLYLHKLQQLQQAQARGQQVPPQQIQMLQAHQHYLAVLASTPNGQQGFNPHDMSALEGLNGVPDNLNYGFPNPAVNGGLGVPPGMNYMNPGLNPANPNANANPQQQQQQVGVKSKTNIKPGTTNGTPTSSVVGSTNGDVANPNQNPNQASNDWYMDNSAMNPSFNQPFNPSTFNPNNILPGQMSSIPSSQGPHPNIMVDPTTNMMFTRLTAGDNINIATLPNFIDPHLGLPSSQKIPLPPWLQSHGEKRHSEKQLNSNDDLTARKKKYRLSLCIYCSKVYPQSPWASLKSRKFEHEIFRKHEKSSLHQRALLELNKSAVSGNPATLQLAMGAMPMMGALHAAKRAAYRQQPSANNMASPYGNNAAGGVGTPMMENIQSFSEFYSSNGPSPGPFGMSLSPATPTPVNNNMIQQHLSMNNVNNMNNVNMEGINTTSNTSNSSSSQVVDHSIEALLLSADNSQSPIAPLPTTTNGTTTTDGNNNEIDNNTPTIDNAAAVSSEVKEEGTTTDNNNNSMNMNITNTETQEVINDTDEGSSYDYCLHLYYYSLLLHLFIITNIHIYCYYLLFIYS